MGKSKPRCIWIRERLRIAEMPLSLGQNLVWLSSGSCYPSATSARVFECVRSVKAGKAIYTYHILTNRDFFSYMSTYWAILFAFLHFLNSSFASPRWPGSIRRVRANLRQSRSRTTALGQRFFKAWHGLTRQQQVSNMAHLMTYDMSSVISFWRNSTALACGFFTLSKLFPFQTLGPIDQQNAFGYKTVYFEH